MWKTTYNPNYAVNEQGLVIDKNRERLLPQRKDTDGYSVVTFNNGGTSVEFVHRLVAEAFVPNPQGLSDVNHIDENKDNNSASNLEWCTKAYNNNFGGRTDRMANTRRYNSLLQGMRG